MFIWLQPSSNYQCIESAWKNIEQEINMRIECRILERVWFFSMKVFYRVSCKRWPCSFIDSFRFNLIVETMHWFDKEKKVYLLLASHLRICLSFFFKRLTHIIDGWFWLNFGSPTFCSVTFLLLPIDGVKISRCRAHFNRTRSKVVKYIQILWHRGTVVAFAIIFIGCYRLGRS